MATMNVSLPDPLKDFVETQVSERGFGTSSEFVRDLIRREQARTQLRDLVLAGMGSAPGSEMDDDYFGRLRERVRATENVAAENAAQ
jgi:antitoxin ParD1/3/4